MTAFERFSQFIALLSESPAVVKITAFFLAWVVVWLPLALPVAIVVKWRPFQPLALNQKLALVISLYACAPLLLWSMAHLEGVPFTIYGLTWQTQTLVSLAAGLGLGTLGVVLLVGLETWFGWIDWQQAHWRQGVVSLAPTLVLGLLISLIEELVFRGFLLNQLQQSYALWVAAVGSSVVFSLLHGVWEGRTVVPQLPGLWLMGLVLVIARWADGGSLGLAWGLHAGWIWALSSFDAAQVMRYHDRSPEWMTGLAGKPLAGGMGLLLLLATGSALLAL